MSKKVHKTLETQLSEAVSLSIAEKIMREARNLAMEGKLTKKEHFKLREQFNKIPKEAYKYRKGY